MDSESVFKNMLEYFGPPILFLKERNRICRYADRNIFGREICRAYGKRNCNNCQQDYAINTVWRVVSPNGDSVIVFEPPIKSSLGYLYGYPTKITQIPPTIMRIARQGTTSTSGCNPLRKRFFNRVK